MSTRSIVKVILNGETRICQYKQSDGYPTYQGIKVLTFVQDLVKTGRVAEFKKKVSASKSIKRGYSDAKSAPAETCTGAPTTFLRDLWLNLAHDVRVWYDENGHHHLRSWKDAVKFLLEKGEINEKQADWLIVAGRDSGVDALEWLMEIDRPLFFYLPKDLLSVPDFGGSTGCDSIPGVYMINLDHSWVQCGYQGRGEALTFSELNAISREEINEKMKRLEEGKT